MAVGCVGGNRRRGRGFRIGRRRRVVTGRARRAAGEKGQQGERGDRFHRAILGGCGRWKKRLSLFTAPARSATPPPMQHNYLGGVVGERAKWAESRVGKED